jgi:phage-related protein
MTTEPSLNPVIRVGSSRDDLLEFPEDVQDHMGYALYVAQGRHRDTKALNGFGGAGVMEVIKNYRGDTFRAVYTVRFSDAVYSFMPFRRNRKADGDAAPGN